MWPFSRKGDSGFSSSSTAEEVTLGIHVVVGVERRTGASSGIGAETARVLALRGVHVIMGVIDMMDAYNVKDSILKQIPTAKVDVMKLDLKNCENNLNVLHFVEHNLTGHFLLTNLLLEIMKKTATESKIQGRIINVSSIGHRFTYPNGILFDKLNDPSRAHPLPCPSVHARAGGGAAAKAAAHYDGVSKEVCHHRNCAQPQCQQLHRFHAFFHSHSKNKSRYNRWRAYGQSKLANILHANELARRFKEDGVDITANSLHPGVINNTNIYLHNRFLTGLRNILGPFVMRCLERIGLKNVQQGASTTCYLALHPEVSGINGKYFADNNVSETCLQGRDMDLAKKLWDFSMNLTMKNEQ
ncbi:hypothetical protein V8G54_012089 [Vigna mungo]|uniref:Short-chain dehydrogenase TIC 32, chloroplastic n=1 Tax=Vigna mungo TaxID=3915 RepID=A0AAQ3S316_VIGMU